jgi:amino acid adenylation domain-containing protein
MKSELKQTSNARNLSDRIASLSPAKRALLRKKLEGNALFASIADQMIRRPIQDTAPLSYAQERLWFLDRWETGSSFYNVPMAFRVKGPLDTGVLERSLKEIVRRHEVLRTTFVEEQGQGVQRISAEAQLEFMVTDLEQFPEGEREAEVGRCIAMEVERPFDLAQGPLLRANVIRLSEQEHVLVFVLHHIVTDGWSMGVLFQELNALYESYRKGEESPLRELPIQYADFAVWQRGWLQGEVLEREVGYWEKRLEGLAVLELPTDRPRPPVVSYRGAQRDFTISGSLLRDLKGLSRSEGVTLYMALLAAFQTLLHRYSGQEDIGVGSPIANRNRAEIEGLIGFFVNTLVLRTDMGRDPSFRELLGRVREAALGAYAHQDVPFEKVVEELNPVRDSSRSPLFQVMFVLQNMADAKLNLAGVEVESLPEQTRTSKFDLTLFLTEEGEGLRGSIEYSTDLFDGTTIERMVGHLQTLLEGIVANADQRISELPILTEGERHQLLVEWNETKVDYPRDACIHELFEAQVERTPDRIAVVFEDKELTYRELNERANKLAHYLRKKGVGPEVLVGICMERSIEMVVGLLGILKAGGAYVPLDPAYPQERLSFMIRDTGLSFVLTQSWLMERIPDVPDILFLDTESQEFGEERSENIEREAVAENLAYVMYTSGSTGRPKGVEVLHRGVVRLVMNAGFAKFADKTFLQLAPLAFDASTFELWAPLLRGGKCVVHPAGGPSPEKLGEVIRQHRVSTLWLTASLFNMVIDEAPETLQGVSQLLIGGEQLSTLHVRRAQEQLTGTRIINGYGPTECTTFSCCYEIPEGIGQDTMISIGTPIANTQVYVLDGRRDPVPIGLPGELYIGGDGLARGYLNRPELTAERFMPDPFSLEPGARLYKTGDLVRYREDGNIEFLGRMDDQVKVRGFRIELGEIEAVLGQHEGIRQAVVAVREEGGDKRLVAYVVREEEGTGTGELRRYLQEKLPEYMIPSVFVFLAALPLNVNGKVDRKGLPAPEWRQPELAEGYVAPRTPTEEALAGIWAELLGLEQVGIHDNFFELGGHSLLAVRLFSKIDERFEKKLRLSDFFQSPTVEGIAALLEWEENSEAGPSIVKIRGTGSKLPIFVIHDLAGEIFFANQLAAYFGADQPVYGFYNGTATGIIEAECRLGQLAERYAKDLMAFYPKGPYCLVGYSFGGHLAYEVACQLSAHGLPIGHLGIIDTGCSNPGNPSLRGCMAGALACLRNLPFWVWEDILHSEPGELAQRVRRKSRQIGKWLKNSRPTRNCSRRGADLEDIFDLKRIPSDYVRMMKYHLDLLRNYRPRPYAGSLTLYKARSQPLICSSETDSGWGKLVSGRVEVIEIPGNHDNIIREPRIRLLAAALGAEMDKTDRSYGIEGKAKTSFGFSV